MAAQITRVSVIAASTPAAEAVLDAIMPELIGLGSAVNVVGDAVKVGPDCQVPGGMDHPELRAAHAIFVIGGDGTLIQVAKQLHRLGRPFVGWNAGRVGFLMNDLDDRGRIREYLTAIADGRVDEQRCYLIVAELTGGPNIETVLAFNELTIERAGQQTARLDVWIDGEGLGRYSGDGLIVASAQGSTAYGVAAGGPAVDGDLPSLTIIPSNPHRALAFSPLTFPLVLAPTRSVTIIGNEFEKRPIRVVFDGEVRDGIAEVRLRTDYGVSGDVLAANGLPGPRMARIVHLRGTGSRGRFPRRIRQVYLKA